jgi:hypothetical protein
MVSSASNPAEDNMQNRKLKDLIVIGGFILAALDLAANEGNAMKAFRDLLS